ncbi:MAG: hypothetical protein KJ571_15280 [Bacteroidetes bacterium]|nr:hypothetical protein [Bacteroidota bacterium]
MKLTIKKLLIIILACFSFLYGQTNSEILKRQAIENMQSGFYERAIDRLKNYISINPFDADGYSLRGLCYERLDNLNNAYYDFKRAKQIDSTDSEILRNFDRVETEWKNSIYKEIDYYKNNLKTDPEYADNYLKIADSYVELENYTLAEKWYDEYLKREHNSTPEEILKYSEVFAKNNSIVKGENLLSVYILKYPNDWRLITRHGYFKLWLGKNEEAINSFNTALEIKPFNKEAEDGLKLAKSYVSFSVSEMLPQHNSALIESYKQILLNDPNKDDVRFNLIEQLVKSGLYDEAYSHLSYLSPNYVGISRFDDLMDITAEGREEYNDKLIDSYTASLQKNKNDKQTLVKLVNLYNSIRNYSSSADLMEDYLSHNSNADDIYFLLAKTLSYDSMYDEAFINIQKAIKINPDENSYKILASKIIVLNKDDKNYNLAFKLLNESINKNPFEIDALTFLGRLNFLKGNYKDANIYAMKAAQLDASNPDLVSLLLDLEEKNPKQPETEKVQTSPPVINNLEIGRNLALNSKCDEAIDYYLKYIDEKSANKDLLLEFADVYICAQEFGEAIDIYNFLLERKDDYHIKKLKAKAYYLDDDFDSTIDILAPLAVLYPNDYELQILLADAYANEGEYNSSNDIYTLIEQDAPENLLVSQRKEWLPVPDVVMDDTDSGSGNFTENFFSYANFYPEIYFYHGNDGFDFNKMGTGGEIGLFENISIGGNVHRGYLANNSGNINYMSYLGNIIYMPSKYWKIKAGYGKMTSVGNIDQPIYEGSVEYRGHTRYTFYSASANYKYTDAATLMFSQELTFTRLSAHYGNLTGWYKFRKGLNIYADYKIYLLENTPIFINENIGNSIDLKIAKEFYEDFKAGYQYFFEDFKYKLATYYSPHKFSSHSFWADWDIHTDIEWDLNLMGRIGYIPDQDKVIRDISARIVYKGFENLQITANAFAGDTSRNNVEYRSFYFYLTASWNFLK